MTSPARLDVLANLPLFGALDPSERARLAALFTEASHHRGEVICREGDEGDRLYVVLEGELEVLSGGEDGTVVQRLGRGDFFGELALLLGGPRTATVVVRRAARLLALDRIAFERTFLRNAKALAYIARTLSKRLASTSHGEVKPKTVTVVAVAGEPGVRGKSLVAATLAHLLADMTHQDAALVQVTSRRTSANALPLASVAQTAGDAVRSRLERRDDEPARLAVWTGDDASWEVAFDAIVTAMAGSFAFVVFDVTVTRDDGWQAVGGVADVLVHVSTDVPERPPFGRRRALLVLDRGTAGASPIPISDGEPFVVPHDPAVARLDAWAAARHLRAARRSPAAMPLHRLARRILGTTVGIALGGGAAFGIAHIGVLQVLDANDVPIDVLAGTSMGSAIALGYGAGTSPDEMDRLARRLGRLLPLLGAIDPTLTLPGLLAGDRMVDFLRPFLGEARRFEDLLRPCRAVATDIERGERIQITSGPLDAALRASCSVPVVWSPTRRGDRALVDGVLVDPVPAQVAYEMGADVCFAVNVIPLPSKDTQTLITRIARHAYRLNPLAYFGDARHLPNLLEIFMNSMQILWHELGNFRAIAADVRIEPDLCSFTWTDYHRPQEIVERGVAAAEAALPAIRRALAAKLSASTAPAARGRVGVAGSPT